MIKKVHLQFLSNQGGSICIPIQTHFFSERENGDNKITYEVKSLA